MDLEAEISSIVSKTLYITENGISSKMANMHKNFTNIESMLFAAIHPPNFKLFYGGSSADGTGTLRSDVDRMMVVPNILVRSSPVENINRTCHTFRKDPTNCRDGFYVLIKQQLRSGGNDFFDFYQQDITCMLEKNNANQLCLSSTKMYSFSVLISQKNAPCTLENTRNGPAVTEELSVSNGNSVNKIKIDFCLGLKMDKWPVEADEWVTRQRTCDWPKQGMIKKVRSLDCHLVPVGDDASPSSHLQWRLSFLLCERELVWSFNDIQMQHYFLLKELLKSELEQLYPKQLSSYCMKTAVFWYSESHDPNDWNEYNLLGHVKYCLLYILSCIEKRELSHYFDRRRNLLFSKFTDITTTQDVTDKIKAMSENIILPVLNLLEQEDVRKAWRKSKNDPNKFLQKCNDVDFLSVMSFPKHRNQHEQMCISQLLRGTSTTIENGNVRDLLAKLEYLESQGRGDIDREFFVQVKKKMKDSLRR